MNAADCYEKVKTELTDFGKNPVADVGKIVTLVQVLGVPIKEVTATAQHIYSTHYQKVNVADANQSQHNRMRSSEEVGF